MERKGMYQVAGGLQPIKVGEVVVDLWPPGTLDDVKSFIELSGGEGEEARISILVPVQHARALADVLRVFADVAEGLPSPVMPTMEPELVAA